MFKKKLENQDRKQETIVFLLDTHNPTDFFPIKCRQRFFYDQNDAMTEHVTLKVSKTYNPKSV